MKKRHSLYFKLLAFIIALTILPFFGSTYILTREAINNIEENTLTYVELFTNQISSNIDSFIGELDRMMKTASNNKGVCALLSNEKDLSPLEAYNATSIISSFIFNLTIQQPQILNASIISNQSDIYTYGSTPIITNDTDFFQFSRLDDINQSEGKIVISSSHAASYLFEDPGSPVFSVGRLIKDTKYITVGSIILTMKSDDMLRSIKVSPSLIRDGARVVVTNNLGQIIIDTADNHASMSDMTFQFSAFEGNAKFVTAFADSAHTNTSVYVIIPADNLFSNENRFYTFSLILISILILIILFAASYLSYRFVKPIKKLERATCKIQEGNFDIQVNIRSKDEIGSLASSFNAMIQKIKSLVENVYVAQINIKQAQFDALQNQINPHFLHNTLESIRMKAIVNNDPEVATMIKKLGLLFRITLDRQSHVVTIREEVEHATAYLAIQNMRHNNRFQLNIEINDKLLSFPILKYVLQPIVENSIVHGYNNRMTECPINIQAVESQKSVQLVIFDQGDGIRPDILENLKSMLNDKKPDDQLESTPHSIGLPNINNRLVLEYGKSAALKIESSVGYGTKVWIILPKTPDYHERR